MASVGKYTTDGQSWEKTLRTENAGKHNTIYGKRGKLEASGKGAKHVIDDKRKNLTDGPLGKIMYLIR